MISLKSVSVNAGDKTILADITIQVTEGELLFLAGRNGSGKSTLFQVLSGRRLPATGIVETFGKKVVYQQQQSIGLADMTVQENLDCFNFLFRAHLSSNQLAELLCKVGLEKAAFTNANSLSGGEKQRMGLAITLMRQGDIYLFDEADSAMDPIGRSVFFEVVKELHQQGKTVIWVSHHLRESLGVANRCCLLSGGALHSFDARELYEKAGDFSEDSFVRFCEERVAN